MKKIHLLLGALVALTACSQKPQQTAQPIEEPVTIRSLVLYYSQDGATRQVAELLAQKTGAVIDSIVAETPYNGSFEETIARCHAEMQDSTLSPIKSLNCNVADYDTIYLGYPIWFGTYARPIATLVSQNKFEGKVIIPFCTFGSGGLENSVKDLSEALPKARVQNGYGVRNARLSAAPEELDKFLIRKGVKLGEVEALQPFSIQVAVDKETRDIFDAACGNYPMPLGRPISVGTRKTSQGTEYEFTSETQDKSGFYQHSKIYVIKADKEGAVPEFTRVVR